MNKWEGGVYGDIVLFCCANGVALQKNFKLLMRRQIITLRLFLIFQKSGPRGKVCTNLLPTSIRSLKKPKIFLKQILRRLQIIFNS